MDRADDQAVNSRLLVRRQKIPGSQRCWGELVELTETDCNLKHPNANSIFLHSPWVIAVTR